MSNVENQMSNECQMSKIKNENNAQSRIRHSPLFGDVNVYTVLPPIAGFLSSSWVQCIEMRGELPLISFRSCVSG